jgi:hypothetical protein
MTPVNEEAKNNFFPPEDSFNLLSKFLISKHPSHLAST